MPLGYTVLYGYPGVWCLNSFPAMRVCYPAYSLQYPLGVTSRGHLQLGSPSIKYLIWQSHHVRLSVVAMLHSFHRIGWGISATGSGVGWVWIRDLEQGLETLPVRNEQGYVGSILLWATEVRKFLFLREPSEGFSPGTCLRLCIALNGSRQRHWPFFNSMYRNAGKSSKCLCFSSHRLSSIALCSQVRIYANPASLVCGLWNLTKDGPQ
jgi:hypothetical protein